MRECGDCEACCIVPSISGLKSVNTVCPNLDQSKSCHKCKIYEYRPKECSDFECSWKLGYGDHNSQPNKNNLLTTIKEFNNGVWIIAIETAHNSAVTSGKNILIDLANGYDLPIIIQSFNGIATGDRTVIKNSLIGRTKAMVGEFITWLDDDNTIGVYNLINPGG